MNTSNNSLWLKQIDNKLNTNSTSLSSIDTKTLNNGLTLANIQGELQTIDTSLNNIETDADNLSANRRLNFSSQYQNLQWSGSSNSLSSGDYSSTTGKAWFQNTTWQTAIITKITFGFLSSETTWTKNRIFTSTSSSGSSFIRWGTADDTTAIDTEIIKFSNNGEITSCMVQNFTHPDGSGDVYYGFVVNDLNIILDNNEYFICEFSGTINASGDEDVWTGIYIDVKQS